MKKYLIIILLLVCCLTTASAQHPVKSRMPSKKPQSQTTKKPIASIPELINQYKFAVAAKELHNAIALKNRKRQPTINEEKMLNAALKGINMLSATQKICIIDSMVVKKADFLQSIKLNKESGTLATYDTFFNTKTATDGYVYTNEFGNKCYFAQKDTTGHLSLYTSDKLGGKWGPHERLRGLEDIKDDINYPFMMTDGTTLYFAAKGDESIGGYDIFVTRYDADKAMFLKPENVGMPFNSPANDYMYAENDIDSIGWFVSDRNQSADNVCVYIFVPSDTRKVYDTKLYPQAQIERSARIQSIKDTWNNLAERNAYMQKYAEMLARNTKRDSKNDFEFVINDEKTYTRLSDFKSPTNKEQFVALQKMKKEYELMEKNLDNMRTTYSQADDAGRKKMTNNILNAEKGSEKLHADISKMEKSIRNTENILYNNNKE